MKNEKLPIGEKQLQQARETLRRYRQGKANLEQRIIDNEQWYKMRHWECMRKEKNQVEPSSGWLFNAIANKHADAMDNIPAPSILPREKGDQAQAEILSAIVPVVLEQNDFEEVYHNIWDYKLKAGTGVYGVFWDKSKLNGLGDITITKVDILNLFWESGVTDIQASRNLFHVQLLDNDLLLEKYPQLASQLGETGEVSKYIYDDAVDTTEKTAVVDWYYKKGGRLHYCKFAGSTVLFATENEPDYAHRGWYDHGLYPFVFDPLFRVEGSPCGFSYIDVGKSAQEYIDRGNQAIMQNLLANTKPRHFIRSDGCVNEQEYADLTKEFVHVEGPLSADSIVPIEGKQLGGIYVEVINNKIDELKEVTGNRDISTGGTSSGVTAASAIAAMQEAGSKLSRDNNKASYRAFRRVVLMVIELIRQFYDLPRTFRVTGADGAARFMEYSNQSLKVGQFGAPVFDVQITAQKKSPYSRVSQNELALQFYSAGFFDPQLSQQALACLEMMDFDGKQFVMSRIARNGDLAQRRAQLAQVLGGAQMAAQLAQQQGGKPKKKTVPAPKGDHSVTAKARQRVAESTNPT